MPRWSMLVTQPNAIMGHASMVRYALKATKSPAVMRPATTSRVPAHSTTSADSPRQNARLGKNRPWIMMTARLRATYSRLAASKRSSSAGSRPYARTTRTPASASCAMALSRASCAWIRSERW